MTWRRELMAAPLRGVALAALAPVVLVHGMVSLLLWGPVLLLGLVVLAATPIEGNRRLTDRWRRLIGTLGGTGRPGEIGGAGVPSPYREPPARPEPDADGLYPQAEHLWRSRRAAWLFTRIAAWSEDPASGRDLTWMLTYPVVALFGLVPGTLIVGGAVAPWLGGAPLWTALAVPVGVAVAPWFAAVPVWWTRRHLGPIPPRTLARRRARQRWVEHNGLILVRLAALAGLALLGLPLLAFSILAFVPGIGLGMVFLLPTALSHFRWLADLRRGLSRDWSGVAIDSPYRPVTEPEPRPDGRYRVGRDLYRSERMARFNARSNALWSDAASWRDLLWLTLDPLVGGVLAALPVIAVAYGSWALTLGGAIALFGGPHDDWYAAVGGNVSLAVPVGILLTVAGLRLAPSALRLHGRWTALLLRPTRATSLALRVEGLTRARADAADDQASEVRRIERDLHDGAQARLVALGLTLGTVERLIETDPDAARRLVAQAKDISVSALVELRRLVRGIHPPVLSERGLADAVRALALDSPVPVEVGVDLPGRAAAPVESAVYFATSEALTNAVRHAGATSMGVDLTYRDGRLRVVVRDDGHGGADEGGSGLSGVRRRLAAFDGTLTVTSPPGGPTVVTMELPCVLSSPKTSTSSATG